MTETGRARAGRSCRGLFFPEPVTIQMMDVISRDSSQKKALHIIINTSHDILNIVLLKVKKVCEILYETDAKVVGKVYKSTAYV